MIYQVQIGANDNAYIITGGIDLTDFVPTIILGDETGVRINTDSKDDNIFTPWIKKSLMFTIIKNSIGQYDDIIAGNDNETYGILIENGCIYWVDDEDPLLRLRISEGGILKFIGTLALESYVEQYKQTSIVQFTFHDRIGTMEDDIFYTNSRFKSIADILACCLSNVMCSYSLYLEWPYTLSSSDDPTEILIDIERFDGKKKIDVLEQVLSDFGMQFIVDYEIKPVIYLMSCGSLVIRNVVENVQQNIVYWGLTLNSYVSSVCGREYYTYTGSKVGSILKLRYLLNTVTYPLINNDSTLSLERVGSAIKAKNELSLKDNIIYGGTYNRENTTTNSDSPYDETIIQFRYCKLGYIDSEQEVYDVTSKILELMDDVDLSAISGAFATSTVNGEGMYLGPSYLDLPAPPAIPIVRLLIGRQIFFNNNQLISGEKIKLDFEITAKTAYGGDGGKYHACIFVKQDGQYYYFNGVNLDVFTDWYQLKTNTNSFDLNASEDTNSFTLTLNTYTNSDIMVMPALISIGGLPYEAIITKFNMSSNLDDTDYYPNSINITTVLSGNNRKEIEIESKILNTPNIKVIGNTLDYAIADTTYDYPVTLDYKSLSQTILAHLSDQYAWQYNGNRWNLDGSCKCFPRSESLNITGQFGLDDKILIFLNGEYDAKRKILKGKWGQVLEVGDDIYRLEKDNFDHFTWDDGNYIMLN